MKFRLPSAADVADRLPLLIAPVLILACLSGPARAQVAASASVQSDYEVQGVSLSNGRPVVSASASYDRPGGVYAGATLTAVFERPDGLQPLSYVVYLGYSARVGPGLSWDAGVVNTGVTEFLNNRYSKDYTEIYGGFTKNNVAFHVYYSPNYIGKIGGAFYVELNGALVPAQHWRLFAHAGMLVGLDDRNETPAMPLRGDVRAGVAREFGPLEVRLALARLQASPVFMQGYSQPRTVVLLGANYFF